MPPFSDRIRSSDMCPLSREGDGIFAPLMHGWRAGFRRVGGS